MVLTPMADDTTKEYSGDELASLAVMPNYNGWIFSHFRAHLGGRAVEFGAGLGTVSAALAPAVDSLELVEPSPRFARVLKDRFAAQPNVSVVASTFEAAVAHMPDRSRDVAVMVNVLEHIEDDIAALRELFRILAPGGRLLLFVPALPSLYSEFDRRVGHFRRYRLKPLCEAVSASGYDIVRAGYFDSIGVLSWWLINKVAGVATINPRLARLYDRVFVPPLRILEGLVPPPVGKNVVLVARKASD